MIPARPDKSEYAEFYANYISQVREKDVVSALRDQSNDLRELFTEVSALKKEDYRYAAGKWSVKEMLGHIIDGERVFSYRALRISRGDQIPLASFDENEYVAESNFQNSDFADLLDEFLHLRAANVLLFKNLTENAWLQIGTASGAAVSVRALAFIMVGHARHHANILRERYLV